MKNATGTAILLLVMAAESAFSQGQPPIWVILHMADTVEAIRWGSEINVAGIEGDLQFKSDGTPEKFKHGWPCDCSCLLYEYGVCKRLGPSGCNAETAVDTWFRTVASAGNYGLVVLDSKVDSSTSSEAGAKLVKMLDDHLFGNGYRGVVIISVAHFDGFGFLNAAATASLQSANGGRIYFTIDQEGKDAAGVLKKLTTLASPNRVYGTGVSACSAAGYQEQTLLAKMNQQAGVTGFVYIWTIEKDSSTLDYVQHGATGIMTNNPPGVTGALTREGYTLARPTSTFPPATSDAVISTDPKCDCDYHPGGCSISSAAPANLACLCTYKGAWTCGGSVVVCQDPNADACRNPTTSFESCAQGRGDCQGYKNVTCDCDYHRGGSTISKAAPANTACRCDYKGFWTCGGNIVRCKDFASQACIAPSMDKPSCEQGGGDCGGYK